MIVDEGFNQEARPTFSSKNIADVHYANEFARASWKVHISITVGSRTGTRSSASSSFCTWSRGALVVLSTSMLVLKMYLFVGATAVLGVALGVVTGVPFGVVTGLVYLYAAGAGFELGIIVAVGFVLGVVVAWRLVAGFWNVTDEYGGKLSKGLFDAGLSGVVDTFWTFLFCFFAAVCDPWVYVCH